MDEERVCCYLGDGPPFKEECHAKAEWDICGLAPDSCVDSCDLHVWKLIDDSPQIVIQQIDGSLSFTLTKEELVAVKP